MILCSLDSSFYFKSKSVQLLIFLWILSKDNNSIRFNRSSDSLEIAMCARLLSSNLRTGNCKIDAHTVGEHTRANLEKQKRATRTPSILSFFLLVACSPEKRIHAHTRDPKNRCSWPSFHFGAMMRIFTHALKSKVQIHALRSEWIDKYWLLQQWLNAQIHEFKRLISLICNGFK